MRGIFEKARRFPSAPDGGHFIVTVAVPAFAAGWNMSDLRRIGSGPVPSKGDMRRAVGVTTL
jgi:hypothetical protein